jgi:adenylosuccinate synthase
VVLPYHRELDAARELIDIRLADANETLSRHGLPTFTTDQIWNEVAPAIERLRPHITNTIPILHKAWKKCKTILFEGAKDPSSMWTSALTPL